MNEDILTLSEEEMDMISDNFNEAFPGRDLTIIHQKESHIAHIDLGILYKKDNYTIIYTMGMSNFIMDDNTACEIFIEVPNEMFKIEPTKEICEKCIVTTAGDLINTADYGFIIQDLLNIALMPSNGELYLSGETIETSNRLYGLLEFFRKPNVYNNCDVKYMYLSQLSTKDLKNVQGITLEQREQYFSKLIGPIKK